jgi:hypothetical protein
MSILSKTAKRTCAALVVGLAHQPNPHSQLQHCFTNGFVAVAPHLISSRTRPTTSGSRRWSSSSSSFQPPIPPQSQGQAVYQDIDFASSASTSNAITRQRNSDPAAVFVVTGASRGIGLQFVKTLVADTQVRLTTGYYSSSPPGLEATKCI